MMFMLKCSLMLVAASASLAERLGGSAGSRKKPRSLRNNASAPATIFYGSDAPAPADPLSPGSSPGSAGSTPRPRSSRRNYPGTPSTPRHFTFQRGTTPRNRRRGDRTPRALYRHKPVSVQEMRNRHLFDLEHIRTTLILAVEFNDLTYIKNLIETLKLKEEELKQQSSSNTRNRRARSSAPSAPVEPTTKEQLKQKITRITECALKPTEAAIKRNAAELSDINTDLENLEQIKMLSRNDKRHLIKRLNAKRDGLKIEMAELKEHAEGYREDLKWLNKQLQELQNDANCSQQLEIVNLTETHEPY